MQRLQRILIFIVVVLVVALVADIAYHGARDVFAWFELHTGIQRGGPDPFYNFWSGIGSDLGEYVIVTAAVAGVAGAYRKGKCHDPGCPRLGKHLTEGGTFHFCHHHHPELMHAAGRKMSLEEMHWHHHEALRVKHGVAPPDGHEDRRPEGANVRP